MTFFRKSWQAAPYALAIFLESPSIHAGDQGAQNARSTTLGKSIYDAKCSSCHGLDGKGDGNAAALLSPRPRNFTDGKYEFRTTESGSIPTNEDLIRTVRNGLHGTAMPDKVRRRIAKCGIWQTMSCR